VCYFAFPLLFIMNKVTVVGAFAKLRKATISFVMSVCPSEWNNSAPSGRIFMKFYISVFFESPKVTWKSPLSAKFLGHFSPIVPPSAAGFASPASDAGGLLWRKLERSKSLVPLQVGGFDVPLATAHSKTFLLRMLNDS
jgi:hypothetical protein